MALHDRYSRLIDKLKQIQADAGIKAVEKRKNMNRKRSKNNRKIQAMQYMLQRMRSDEE